MSEWIYFIHPPRDDFAATMTDEERAVWGVHFERFERMLAEGSIILVGPTLGSVNTGIAIFEAPDEPTARRIMDEDPVIAGGFARGELRPFRVSLIARSRRLTVGTAASDRIVELQDRQQVPVRILEPRRAARPDRGDPAVRPSARRTPRRRRRAP